MAIRFCTECGTEMDETKRFCPNCGTACPGGSPGPTAPATPTPPSPPFPSFGQAPAPGGQRRPEQGGPAPSEVLSVGSFLGIFALMLIPVVNIVLLFVWAFGGCPRRTQRNFARAALIMGLITLLLTFICGSLLKNLVQTAFESFDTGSLGLDGLSVGELLENTGGLSAQDALEMLEGLTGQTS